MYKKIKPICMIYIYYKNHVFVSILNKILGYGLIIPIFDVTICRNIVLLMKGSVSKECLKLPLDGSKSRNR